MRLRQTTGFPTNGSVGIELLDAPGEEVEIALRYPAWSGKPEVKVNGRRVKVNATPSSYIPLKRRWKSGDRIEVNYPMELKVETAPDNPHRGAVVYGPVVLAGDLGTEGMTGCAPFSDPTVRNDYYTYDYHIPEGLKTSLSIDPTDPSASLKREGDTLVFTTADGDRLMPLYDLHRRRYVVYWDLP